MLLGLGIPGSLGIMYATNNGSHNETDNNRNKNGRKKANYENLLGQRLTPTLSAGTRLLLIRGRRGAVNVGRWAVAGAGAALAARAARAHGVALGEGGVAGGVGDGRGHAHMRVWRQPGVGRRHSGHR